VGVCLDPFVLKENIEGAYHIHVSMDSDTSSGFIRNPSVLVFVSQMGSQWASIDTTLCLPVASEGGPLIRGLKMGLQEFPSNRFQNESEWH